jgi:hypothetical protein
MTGALTADTLTADTDVVIGGVSLFTALSSYFHPPAAKSYAPYARYRGETNQYVALTTNLQGSLFGVTSDAKIFEISITNEGPVGSGDLGGIVETLVVDLGNNTVPDYNNPGSFLEFSGITDFCFDRNPTTIAQFGGGFYLTDTFNVMWVCLQSTGPEGGFLPSGANLCDPGTTIPKVLWMTTNEDSTRLYFAAYIMPTSSPYGVFLFSMDPYSESITSGPGGYPYAIPPARIYSNIITYGNFVPGGIAYNKTNGLLYVPIYDVSNYNTPVSTTKGYLLSLTTRGTLVQAATNDKLNQNALNGIAVDSSGNILISTEDYDNYPTVVAVHPNFIGVSSAYSTAIANTGVYERFWYMTAGLNGVVYVNDFQNYNVIQLIPS